VGTPVGSGVRGHDGCDVGRPVGLGVGIELGAFVGLGDRGADGFGDGYRE
jgi:hypothetical protein